MGKNKYDEIPIIYCKSCLSLHIENYSSNLEEYPEEGVIDDNDFCKTCGSTNIGYTTIDEWEQMYIKRYGKEPLAKKKK